jgi:hypothetical protein
MEKYKDDVSQITSDGEKEISNLIGETAHHKKEPVRNKLERKESEAKEESEIKEPPKIEEESSNEIWSKGRCLRVFDPFYIQAIKELLRAKYSKQDLLPLIRNHLHTFHQKGFSPCGSLLPSVDYPVKWTGGEEEVLAQFLKYYTPSKQVLSLEEMVLQKPPRPSMNSIFLCYANALYQCLATFQPLIMHFLDQECARKNFPIEGLCYYKYFEILEEFSKDSSVGAFNIRNVLDLPSVGSAAETFYDIFEDHNYPLILNSFEISGLVYHEDTLMGRGYSGVVSNFVLDSRRLGTRENFLERAEFNVKGHLFVLDLSKWNFKPTLKLDVWDWDSGKERRFSLYAMCLWEPFGTIGYYTALVQRGDSWYFCDDTSIRNLPISTQEELDKALQGYTVHLTFYLRA